MDADGWLTKAEVAQALGVDARTVERRARRGVLTSRMRPGFPTMYNPDDVAREAAAVRTVHRAAISGADVDARANGNGHGALVHRQEVSIEPLVDPLVHFLELLTARLVNGPTGPTGPTAPLFLTLDEAAAESHLPAHELRRFIREKRLVPVCGRSARTWRIRRRDVEQL